MAGLSPALFPVSLSLPFNGHLCSKISGLGPREGLGLTVTVTHISILDVTAISGRRRCLSPFVRRMPGL